jgi:ribose transport system ATP-binding protein
VSNLSGSHFNEISFTVRAGEMVGIAGVQGNGQEELVRALVGVEPATGNLLINGNKTRLGSAPALSEAGVVYVPSDRHREGLLMPLSVGENIVMKTLRKVAPTGLVSESATRKIAHEQIDRQSIKTPSSRTAVQSLSGGNQQKVVLARTTLANPTVLVAEEPTQGVDAGARVDIYQILRDAADNGAAVVILSSDGVELEGLCDRVLIMSRGQVVKELVGEEVTEEGIATAALTSTSMRQRKEVDRTRKSLFKSWLSGDHSPAAVLGLIIVGLAFFIGTVNPAYYSSFNISNLLVAASMLILVGAAQQVVVMGSGFDLTVGPMMSFLVVIASFFIIDGGNPIVGVALLLLATFLVGLLNGYLVTKFALSPVVVTLAVALALQGTLFQIRSTPGGLFDSTMTQFVLNKLGGWVPVSAVFAIGLVLVMEWALRNTRWGVELRAVGSRIDAAQRLGINTKRVQLGSYMLTSLILLPAAIVLMSQIGVGDGRPGLSFTLASVTVLVLAGASIVGGRGSFIGIIVAGLLVAQLLGAPAFLGLSGAWGYLLPGLITILAAVLYAQLRRVRR